MRALRASRLPPLRRGHCGRRSDQPLSAGRRRHHPRAGVAARSAGSRSGSHPRASTLACGCLHPRGRMHRVFQVRARLPCRRHPRRTADDAHGDRGGMHGLRAVPAALPCGLHRTAGSRARRDSHVVTDSSAPPGGCAARAHAAGAFIRARGTGCAPSRCRLARAADTNRTRGHRARAGATQHDHARRTR